MNVAKLADILKRLNVSKIGYFHTDHFEPWSPGISKETALGVQRFKKMAEESRFGWRQSLFYKVHIPYRFDLEFGKTDDGLRLPDDPIVFHYRSAKENKLAETVIRELFQSNQHEMHLHAHHEWWTRNDSNYDRPWSKWVNEHSTKERDAARFELFLGMALQTIEQEWGKPLPAWSFVHGQWALNAANPMICKITDEMQILSRFGCLGDFSFPAGADICDPKMEHPFTCIPKDDARCFDHATSEPRPVTAGSGNWSKERFFIWNSKIKAAHSSIDYYSDRVRTHFETPEEVVRCWLEKSVVLNDTLFLKTHAHSLAEQYEVGTKNGVIPHAYPPFVKAFDLLERVCDKAAVNVRLLTAHEVIDALRGFADNGKLNITGEEVPLQSNPVLAAGETSSNEFDTNQFQADFADCLQAYLNKHDDGEVRATNYYMSKLKRHVMLEPYEIGVMEHLRHAHPPKSTRIVEIGVGFGALSLALALDGYEVVGFDGAKDLYDGAEFIRNEFITRHKQLMGPASLQYIFGFYPASADQMKLDRRKTNVLLATNVINSTTAREHQNILAAAGAFDEVWLDLTRFGIYRTTRESIDQFLTELAQCGFELIDTFWNKYEQFFCRFRIGDIKLPAQPASSVALPPEPVPPVKQGSKIFPIYGDLKLKLCPVCQSSSHENLWKVPLTNLKEPALALGSQFNRLPTLQSHQTIYCFDWCNDCESVFLNPLSSQEKNRARTSDYYVNLLKRETQLNMFQRAFEDIHEWIPPGSQTIIDANAGSGAYLLAASKANISSLKRFIGIDLSASCIAELKSSGFEAYETDLDTAPLPDQLLSSADIVLFMEGFESSESPLTALKKLMLSLRPNGRLVLSVPRYGESTNSPLSPSPRIYIGEYFSNCLAGELGASLVTKIERPSKYIFVFEKTA